MSKFATDILSWNWFLSVFVVGVLINLASAYLKPVFDKYFSSRSKKSRARAENAEMELEGRSSAIASDPTQLIIEGQRLASAESRTLTAFVMYLVVLTFGIFAQTSGISSEKKAYLELAVYCILCGLMVLSLYFMNLETRQSVLVGAARKKRASKIAESS